MSGTDGQLAVAQCRNACWVIWKLHFLVPMSLGCGRKPNYPENQNPRKHEASLQTNEILSRATETGGGHVVLCFAAWAIVTFTWPVHYLNTMSIKFR